MIYKLYDDIQEAAVDGRSTETVKADIYKLWRECFKDTKAYTDFYLTWKMSDNCILTIYKGQQISAMLHLNPYTLMAADKKVKSYYIVGVATRPEDRRKGLMKMLLERALFKMNQEGVPFTYLMPAAEAIYLPFDFRVVYEQESWKQNLLKEKQQISKKVLPADSSTTILWLRQEDTKSLNDLVDFSNSLLSEQASVYVLRTRAYYERLIAEMESGKGGVLLCVKDNTILGYIAYMAEGGFQIAEALYHIENKQEFLSATATLLEHGDYKSTDNPAAGSHNPTIMTRIVNWESFIQGISAQEKISLVIKVEDPILIEHNDCYSLTFTEEGSQLTKTDLLPELTGDIAGLTELFFGQLSLEEQKLLITGTRTDIILEKMNKIKYYKPLEINDVV